MANIAPRSQTARDVLAVTTLIAIFTSCGSATAAFYVNCEGCHTVPESGMAIVSFQISTNLGEGLY